MNENIPYKSFETYVRLHEKEFKHLQSLQQLTQVCEDLLEDAIVKCLSIESKRSGKASVLNHSDENKCSEVSSPLILKYTGCSHICEEHDKAHSFLSSATSPVVFEPATASTPGICRNKLGYGMKDNSLKSKTNTAGKNKTVRFFNTASGQVSINEAPCHPVTADNVNNSIQVSKSNRKKYDGNSSPMVSNSCSVRNIDFSGFSPNNLEGMCQSGSSGIIDFSGFQPQSPKILSILGSTEQSGFSGFQPENQDKTSIIIADTEKDIAELRKTLFEVKALLAASGKTSALYRSSLINISDLSNNVSSTFIGEIPDTVNPLPTVQREPRRVLRSRIVW